MKKNTIIGSLVAALLITVSSQVSAGNDREPDLVIVGTVVAYDPMSSLHLLTSAPNAQLIVVRIDNIIEGHEESRYVKVVHRALYSTRNLPPEIFDGNRRWRFDFIKDCRCDGALSRSRSDAQEVTDEGVLLDSGIERTAGAEAEPLSMDAILPCYEIMLDALSSNLRPACFSLDGH